MLMSIDEINKIAEQQLTEYEMLVLRLRAGMEPPEIAERLGTSRQYIHYTLNRARKKIEAQRTLHFPPGARELAPAEPPKRKVRKNSQLRGKVGNV